MTERHIALREAATWAAAEPYFDHRPALDSVTCRRVFDAAFARGYDATHPPAGIDVADLRNAGMEVFGDSGPVAVSVLEWLCAELQARLDRGQR